MTYASDAQESDDGRISLLMSISTVAALLLLSGAPPALADVAPESRSEIEPQKRDGDPPPVEPPVVVPTIETIPSPVPDAPATPGGEPPAGIPPSPNEIVVTAREEAPPGDPLQEANIASYRVVQSVDKALVAPVATGYQGIVPEPVRDGLGNALRNLSEPINFLNFLLQFKLGKAAETLGRFVVNTTFGVGGLVDVAKTEPFNLPYRRNGFANTLGFYGVEPGPYFYLPLLGPTTLRDLAGNSIDLLVVERRRDRTPAKGKRRSLCRDAHPLSRHAPARNRRIERQGQRCRHRAPGRRRDQSSRTVTRSCSACCRGFHGCRDADGGGLAPLSLSTNAPRRT
ncbi:MAG: VacJ family lipoprotein [Sphingomonadales bacterium]|nr:MAG: VacJ family lipoprotein [Sphingomonadales bacterium]